jgi:mannose-6-phosphate isomerase
MSDVTPYPFRTRPYTRVKVWGGRQLPETFDKPAPDDEPVGEAWEVADLDEGESLVGSGPLEGQPLSELVERWGDKLIGTASPTEDFPLLVKLLDAADDLSVQVHPSEKDVREQFPEADSKDECWLIVGVEEGGSILHGVRDGTTPEEFERAVDEGRAAELLRRVHVEPGQIVRVVPGTIHAICEGVTLLEIQQPSDTTYRVYDYNRPGLDGEPRELHLDKAMAVANFDEQPPTALTPESLDVEDASVELIVDVPSYRVERVELDEPFTWRIDSRSPQVVFALDGELDLAMPGSEVKLTLTRGQTAVVPAAVEQMRAEPRGDSATIVVSGIGGGPLVAR